MIGKSFIARDATFPSTISCGHGLQRYSNRDLPHTIGSLSVQVLHRKIPERVPSAHEDRLYRIEKEWDREQGLGCE